MSIEKYPMTPDGYERSKKELEHLKKVDRPAVIQDIAEASAHGDLSENAEYSAARERQSWIEGRIKHLEGLLAFADVIDSSTVSSHWVQFGAYVNLEDIDSGEIKDYRIVGESEAEVSEGLLSIVSPLARALIGKSVGDVVEVKTPRSVRSYEILKISYA